MPTAFSSTARCVLALAVALLWSGCSPPSNGDGDGDSDGDSDGDVDADVDADADSGDGDVDADLDQEEIRWCAEASYIWIANSLEGTLSKVCTLDGVEISRFYTSPQEGSGDPSRTSVNLHGDAVVTNRDPSYGPSSVTKFASELDSCVDRNGNLRIDTSTGPEDVLPFGEDECMLWNTPLPDAAAASSIGARATAWDGTEDADTGTGGTVWIGALTGAVFQLDGQSGAILARAHAANQPYGGAMDGLGNFWIVGMGCTLGLCTLVRVNTSTLETTPFPVPCGYGIAVDSQNRIWTSGSLGINPANPFQMQSCVNRLDPELDERVTYRSSGGNFFYRGIAVDDEGSVWVAETSGAVLQVDEETVELIQTVNVAAGEVVGVAVDYQHQIWAVSNGSNVAIRIDPATYAYEHFPVGLGPYTYSDMTGFQLRAVIW